MLYADITEAIIDTFFKVHKTVGPGCSEDEYENAMMEELIKKGLRVESHKKIKVRYSNNEFRERVIDLMVNDSVILSILADYTLRKEHKTELKKCLKATNTKVGLLLNFGKKADFQRMVLTKEEMEWQ